MAEPAELAGLSAQPIKAEMLHAFCDVPAYVLVRLDPATTNWIFAESKNIDEGEPCLVRSVCPSNVTFENVAGDDEMFPVLDVEIHLGAQRLVIAGTHPDSFVSWCTEALWIDQI